jgi:hypothetical protein
LRGRRSPLLESPRGGRPVAARRQAGTRRTAQSREL